MSNLISLQYTTPPALPGSIIPRERLYSLIESCKSKPLVILNATAGYGKTVLLNDYCKKYLQNYSWLTVPSNISNPAHLLKYLISAVKKTCPAFGENTLAYIEHFSGKWNKSNITELVTIFLNEVLSTIDHSLTLIIDDFQNLENENNTGWVSILFTELFTAIPGNFKFIISTRQTPSFKTSRLEAKRHLFNISTIDLRFDLEETTALALDIYGINSSRKYEMLLKQTGGWITAMHMLLQSPKAAQDEDFEFTENLYNYIAEDIFTVIDDDLKKFLAQTAYLDIFDTGFTDKLLNINNSGDLIKKLVSKNIFLEYASSDDGDYYFYQKLFSDFLRRYVAGHTGKEEVRSNYLKIADTYISESKPEEALWFLIKAGDSKRFKEIVTNHIEAKFDALDYYTIEKWLLLAGDLCTTDQYFTYYRLNFLVKTNKFEKISLSEFINFSEQNTGELYYKLVLLKTEYLLLTGNLNESLELLSSMQNKINAVNLKKQYLQLLCKTYYRLGFEYYDILTKTAEESIRYYNDNNILDEKLEVIGYLANINADGWNSLTAIRYHEQGLKLERKLKKSIIHLSILIDLYSSLGNYEKANEYLIALDDVCKSYPIPYFERLLIRSRTKFYINFGDYDYAVKTWSSLEKNESVTENDFLLWNYFIQLTELHYFQNNKNASEQNLLLSEKYLTGDKYFVLIHNFFEKYYCSQNTLSSETEEAIVNMLHYHKSKNLLMVVPQMEYYLAKIHLEKNLYSSAERYVFSAMHTYNEKKQTTFLETELHLSRKLFDFAISQNIEKKFIGTVFDAIKNKLSLDFISDEYREELNRRIFRLTDIYFFPFGNTEFYLRGEAVADDKWIRKKSKILLAYLMSDPEKIHTKDKIMDMFFDDTPADKADVVYHSAIYNIRTALKIYDIKSDKPKRSKDKTYDYNPQYILYEDKTLRLNPDFYYTSGNIEFEKHYSKTKLQSLTIEEKITHSVKAIELYKGDFMPGYYESWCEELRVKYKNMYITLCEELIKLFESEARYEEVIRYSEMLLNEDKLNDSIHISIINAYSKLGNINMAKSSFELMVKVYDEELGEKPQSKTLEKIKPILNKAKDL